MSKVIMGIQILQRTKAVTDVQSLLTEYGCYIKTRLGLHEAAAEACSNKGLILLELIDDAGDEADKLEARLLRWTMSS